tara:strand:- start:1202 stop:1888 length:687 start_codon:yes stop_codon:yes gene_type:complete
MNIAKGRLDHLINNLERNSYKDSIFNYEPGRKAFISIKKANVREWLKTFLPNTRLILEPKIRGYSIAIQYIYGKLNKAIDENSLDITEKIISLRNIPKSIPIKNRIEIQGVLYHEEIKTDSNTECKLNNNKNKSTNHNQINFCAFHIFHCKLSQFNTLQELKKLNLEIPENHFTIYTSDIEIYRECWRKGKLFQKYPSCGIVAKINSRKLQKQLGESKVTRNWAYTIY